MSTNAAIDTVCVHGASPVAAGWRCVHEQDWQVEKDQMAADAAAVVEAQRARFDEQLASLRASKYRRVMLY